MEKQRIHDFAIGFIICLSIVVGYHYGAVNPTNANASEMASDYATIGGSDADGNLAYVVINQSTGKVVFSERIDRKTLATDSEGNTMIYSKERYW